MVWFPDDYAHRTTCLWNERKQSFNNWFAGTFGGHLLSTTEMHIQCHTYNSKVCVLTCAFIGFVRKNSTCAFSQEEIPQVHVSHNEKPIVLRGSVPYARGSRNPGFPAGRISVKKQDHVAKLKQQSHYSMNTHKNYFLKFTIWGVMSWSSNSQYRSESWIPG